MSSVVKKITPVQLLRNLAQSCLTRPILLLACLLASPHPSPPQVNPTDDRTKEISKGGVPHVLKPGTSISQETPGQHSQVFEVTLEANQYLRLSIEKGDLNISLAIYGPGGEKLVEFTDHEYRPLEASLVTASAGSHKLVVKSLEQNPALRRYEVSLERGVRIRPSNLDDHRALKAFGEADRLLAEWNESSLRRAIEKFREASSAWRGSRPDRSVEALRGAADVHFILGEYNEAIDLNRRAVRESEKIGARLKAFEAVGALGRVYSLVGKNDLSRKYLARVLAYSNRNGHGNGSSQEKRLAAGAHNDMGDVYYTEGSSIKALDYFRRALKLWTEVGYRRGQAQANLNIGYASSGSGNQQQALLHFRQAMELYRAVGDLRGEALSLTATGSLYSLQGNEQASLESHMEALRTFRRIGDRRGEGVTLNAVGQAYEDLGELQTALQNYGQALPLLENTGSVASVEYKIAKVHRSLGEFEKALDHYDRCIRVSRVARKRRIEAYALKDIAEIYHSQGRERETLSQYRRILNLYRNLGDYRGQAMTLNSIGDLFFSYGEKHRALVFHKRALPLVRVAGDREGEITTLYKIGRSARDCDLLGDALSHTEQSIKIIEALRTFVASPDLRSSYFASVHQNYELYIHLLMRLDRQQPGHGYAVAALQASESARSRALIEVLAEAGAELSQGMDPKQVERERELQEALAAKERHQMQVSNSRGTQAEVAEVAREISQLTTEEQILQAQMRQQNPRYAALTQPRPLSLEQIQAELRDEDTLLLEYALGDQQSYLWAVTHDSLRSFELPARAALEKAAREVYDLLTVRQRFSEETNYDDQLAKADAAYPEKVLALSQMLLGPVQSDLGKKRLLIVTDGVLQYIPFEALPAPQADSAGTSAHPESTADEPRLLVSDHEVINLPSISVLAAIRREATAADGRHRRIISILADPVFEVDDPRVRNLKPRTADANSSTELAGALRDLDAFGNGKAIPRLPHTIDEAKAILALIPSGQATSAFDFDADRTSVMNSDIGHSQIIHFATHSLINSDRPQSSGILLSMVDRSGAPQNGFLQLRDIYNLKISSRLVVLSACSTGLGKEVKGEGLIGLTRGFMYAGSKGVVASLWKVDDRATAQLMARFYSAMLKDNLPPAAALRVAKESLRKEKRWRAPFYWAAFVMQGEYRERVNVERSPPVSRIRFVSIGLLVLLICACGVYIIRRRRKTRFGI
jgi:CHAT domain-containing protein/tetratricopeptide (TPR) repeat protein